MLYREAFLSWWHEALGVQVCARGPEALMQRVATQSLRRMPQRRLYLVGMLGVNLRRRGFFPVGRNQYSQLLKKTRTEHKKMNIRETIFTEIGLRRYHRAGSRYLRRLIILSQLGGVAISKRG